MPFDITINAKGAGTKEVEYTTTPARTNTSLTPAETALLRGTEPIRELQIKLQAEAGFLPAKPAPPVDEDIPPIEIEMPA